MAQTAVWVPTTANTRTRAWAWPCAVGLLAITILSVFLVPTQADPDLWGHVRFGLDMLAAHSVLRIDRYSFTAAGGLVMDHEWLGDVVLAAFWKAGGAAGLVLLKIAIALITGLLCFFHLVRAGVRWDRALAVLLALIILLPQFTMVRPLLFSVAAFAIVLIVLDSPQSGARRMLWVLPPLFALWANLHGGFVAGLGILTIWAGVRVAMDRREVGILVPLVAATFAATCLNAYGWHLWPFLLHTLTVERPEIFEWAPLRASSPYGLMYFAVLAVSVWALVVTRLQRAWPMIALFALTSLLPFIAIRHTPLAAVSAVLIAGPHVGDLLGRLGGGRSGSWPAWASTLPVMCTLALICLAARQPIRVSIPAAYPVNAVRLIAASGWHGNLANQFNWGEYLIWHLGPGVKVMMDGRREALYPESLYASYLDFQTGAGDWDRILREYRPEVALLQKGSTAANLIELKPEWTCVYHDDEALIFARRNTPVARQISDIARTFRQQAQTSNFP